MNPSARTGLGLGATTPDVRALADRPLVADLLARCSFPEPRTPVTCAVSGGPDSSALLVLAVAAGLRVTAVHIDHGLRVDSALEADHVRRLAARFGAEVRCHRLVVGDGPNLEERARVARRSVLGAEAMTGHTADDQAETVLINLIRGAGLDGLAAMTPGPTHPMLRLRRADTLALCDALELVPITDPSNASGRFVRNRVRNEVLPLLNDISRRDVAPLLERTADVMRSAASALDRQSHGLDPTDVAELCAADPVLAARALRQWLIDEDGHPPSRADLARVMTVVRREAVGCEIAGGRRVRRTAGRLRIESLSGNAIGNESGQIAVGDAPPEP